VGAYRKVPMARRLVTSSLKLRDCDVMLVTSQYSKSSNSETGIRINYPYGSFKHTPSWNIVLENQFPLRTLGEEVFGV